MSVKCNGYADYQAALRRALVLVQVGMIIGFIPTWPVNWWFIRHGIKDVIRSPGRGREIEVTVTLGGARRAERLS
jgi:hypothetical protein